MELHNKLRTLRKELGLTQKEFAAKLGIHLSQITKYEAGISLPSIPILSKIAHTCEISTDYLISGVDKELAKRSRINDVELLEILRQIDNLPKNRREKIKWAIKGIISSE